ncbi:MAG: archaeoflavoprotein AfpA [Candidatus Bathyarchaeota archaeon]|jgi:archaeoflavoprotein AfpA|nr:archaeoflavoprotein AfpA [Candidatus Bathyarchaeota archaeon]
MTENKIKKRKVAWGITGAGDKIEEILNVMLDLKRQSENLVEIEVFVSKAADTVLKFYRLEEKLKQGFPKVMVEVNSNSPFLAAWMQMRKYEFLLIAPATSNTVAKIANSISDTLLTNAAIMSLKAFVPVYILPTDYKESTVYTKLPNGKEMKLRIRKEEADLVRKLERMEDMHVLESPQKLREIFEEWLKTIKT